MGAMERATVPWTRNLGGRGGLWQVPCCPGPLFCSRAVRRGRRDDATQARRDQDEGALTWLEPGSVQVFAAVCVQCPNPKAEGCVWAEVLPAENGETRQQRRAASASVAKERLQPEGRAPTRVPGRKASAFVCG